MTEPYPGWHSMQPDREHLELDATPPEPSYTRTRLPGCSVFAGLLVVLLAWVAW